jgi:Fe-S-cluster containining protein
MKELALCCRAVCLHTSLSDLKAAYTAATTGHPSFIGIDGLEHGVPVDVVEVFEMWTCLGEFVANPLVPEQVYLEPVKLYRCRHVKEGTCSIWSRRPEMCRRYSFGRVGQELFREHCGSLGVTCSGESK